MKGRAILYTDEIKNYIKENQKDLTRALLTETINQKFGTNYKVGDIKSYCKRNKLYNKNTGRFMIGDTPKNKGVKMSAETYAKCKATMFKSGNIPNNHRAIGSERITKDGYIEIKIEEPNKWRLKHLHIFEQIHGKIPKGHCVIFLDQDKTNTHISNFLLIKRSQLLALNKSSLLTNDKSTNLTSITLSALMIATDNATRKLNE